MVCNLLFKHMYAQKIRPMFECSLSLETFVPCVVNNYVIMYIYILTIFLDYGNAKTKQVKVSVYCYGARICKYKALYSFWYIQHVYTNQTMAYILCDGRTTVAVHFHIHEPHIKLLFLSIFYPFISMPIETLCQF